MDKEADMYQRSDAIAKQEAFEIFRDHIEQRQSSIVLHQISNILPLGCRAVNLPQEDCWYVTYSGKLCSAGLIVISKDTGKVVYDGIAGS
jgi:hypothetical protein